MSVKRLMDGTHLVGTIERVQHLEMWISKIIFFQVDSIKSVYWRKLEYRQGVENCCSLLFVRNIGNAAVTSSN